MKTDSLLWLVLLTAAFSAFITYMILAYGLG